MQYDCYVTMEMQQTHYYTTVTITLLWKCNILIVTQQELLHHYGNAIWCTDHVTTENVICHNNFPSVQLISIVLCWAKMLRSFCHWSRPSCDLTGTNETYEIWGYHGFKMLTKCWVLAPCGFVSWCQRFGNIWCLHLQGLSDGANQPTKKVTMGGVLCKWKTSPLLG
jgi:hypothetical protein